MTSDKMTSIEENGCVSRNVDKIFFPIFSEILFAGGWWGFSPSGKGQRKIQKHSMVIMVKGLYFLVNHVFSSLSSEEIGRYGCTVTQLVNEVRRVMRNIHCDENRITFQYILPYWQCPVYMYRSSVAEFRIAVFQICGTECFQSGINWNILLS